MRKLLVVVLVAMMATGAIVAVGCGGDTSQAKQYMQEGDKAWKDAKKQLDELNTMLTTSIGQAQQGNFSSLNAETMAKAGETVAKLITDLQTVKADYVKIKTLKGVEDYVLYADAMVKAVEANGAALQAGNKLLAAILPLLAAGDAQKVTAWMQANMAELLGAQKTAEAATAALEAAAKIKAEKKLGQ